MSKSKKSGPIGTITLSREGAKTEWNASSTWQGKGKVWEGKGAISGIAITKNHIHVSIKDIDGVLGEKMFKADFTKDQARKIFDLFINDTPVDFEAGVDKK